MRKAIYISIKPQFTKKILTGEKNYEYRNYIPKKSIDTLFVYETTPTCAIKYIIKLGKIIKYPEKVLEQGFGNEDFNKGSKEYKYAYKIKSVELLEKSLSLKELKERYNFTAPQSYAYDERYEGLTNYLRKAKTIKLI